MAEKIRHRIARCLKGDLDPDELTASERSYLDLFIYKGACRLLVNPRAINSMPANLKALIKSRAKKLKKQRS